MTIRLDNNELENIITCFKRHFGEQDQLWLFGSRVYPHKRGGDIDLYIEIAQAGDGDIFYKRLNFVVDLKMALGDQKIDVVIKEPALDLPIYVVARQEGVRLV